MAYLFVIIGVPGSGKSTFIRDYVTYYKEIILRSPQFLEMTFVFLF